MAGTQMSVVDVNALQSSLFQILLLLRIYAECSSAKMFTLWLLLPTKNVCTKCSTFQFSFSACAVVGIVFDAFKFLIRLHTVDVLCFNVFFLNCLHTAGNFSSELLFTQFF